MTAYALVIDNVVTEERNYDTPPETKIRDGKPMLRPIQVVTAEYNPATHYHTVSRKVQNNKVVDTWVVQERPRSEVNDRLYEALAAHRYTVETGGITLSGVPIKTDRDTQGTLTAARTLAKEDANYAVEWKVASGQFVTLSAATIIAIANAVAAHVQKCFRAESSASDDVADYSSVAEALAAFDAAMAT